MIQRLFTLAGDENPQIEDDFGRPQVIEMSTTKGFVSIPDTDDEVVVVAPYGSELDRVAIGVVEAVKYGVKPGDRLIITDNAMIKLQKTGQIDILSTSGIINISATGGTINIGGNGQNVNINGTVKINGATPLTA